MTVFFYFGRRYRVSASGSVRHVEECEACGQRYGYRAEVVGHGSAESPYLADNDGALDRAFERAERQLRAALQWAAEAVPCPYCGWYQRHMYPLLQAGRHAWMGYLAVALFVPAGLLLSVAAFGLAVLAAKPAEWAEALPAVAAFAAPGIGLVWASRAMLRQQGRRQTEYDPNASIPVDERVRLSRDVAFGVDPNGEEVPFRKRLRDVRPLGPAQAATTAVE